MEMNELKYFLAAAETENVNKAAKNIAISPGSISKAISKLESEMGIMLFERIGRNIKITKHGKDLQKRASQIINLEETTRIEIGGKEETVKVMFCGEELLLSEYGTILSDTISNLYPNAYFSFKYSNNQESFKKIEFGEAHLAFTTTKPPKHLKSRVLKQVKFHTCVGRKHPLYKYVKKSKQLEPEVLLDYDFVVPDESILGEIKAKEFKKDWQQESFNGIVKYQVSSIKILEALLLSGRAMAYIPDYLIESLDVGILNIIDCPYDSKQTVYMVCRDPKEISWLNQIW
jgi:DNA-binding transcriptional LysR family regulator